jgi:hypothetical protein
MGVTIVKAIVFAAALGTAAVSIVPAQAAIFDVTFTGRILPEADYQFDYNGIFGPTSNLIFGSFTAVFRFDNSLGSRSSNGTSDALLGGSLYPALVNPLLSATLSINGGPAVAFDGSYNVIVDTNYIVQPEHGYHVDAKAVTGAVVTSEIWFAVTGDPSVFSLVDTPFSYTLLPTDGAAGFFELLDEFGNLRAHAGLLPTAMSVTMEGVARTPLPGTLPLFGTGLAAFGFFGWSKRRKVQVA